MESYQKYIDTIINNTYKEINPLIKGIIDNGKCKNCNGSFLDAICSKCGNKNNSLVDFIDLLEKHLKRFEEVLNNLPEKNFKINKLFNLLYSISSIKISCVEKFLAKYNYIETVLETSKIAIEKLEKKEKLKKEELEVLEMIIKKEDLDFNYERLHELLIKNAILKMQNVSYECFLLVIKNFVIDKMKVYYKKPECIITKFTEYHEEDYERITMALSKNHIMWLNEELVKKMYYEGQNALINSIFHELTHSMQYKERFNGKLLNSFIIDEIKEFILANKLDNYYEENYRVINFELEARYFGILNAIEFFEKLGFSIDKKRHNMELEDIATIVMDKKRRYRGKKTTLDKEFDKYILKHPEILKKHTQLKYLYKVENKEVLPKSIEDLENDYKDLMDDYTISELDKQFYKDFYRQYLVIGRNI